MKENSTSSSRSTETQIKEPGAKSIFGVSLVEIINSLTHAFLLIDARSYEVVLANTASGWKPGGQPVTCFDLTHGRKRPCSGKEHPCPLEEVRRTNKPYTVEHVHVGTGDQERIVQVHGYPILNADGELVQLLEYCLDITEQRRAEEALAASEARCRSIVESLNEGIWSIDVENLTTFVNLPMAEMLGYTVEEMLGRHLFSFMDEQGVDICTRNLERRKQGIREQHEFELLHKNGTRIFTIMETSPIHDRFGDYSGAIAGVVDVTERKRAEQALQEAHDLLERRIQDRTAELRESNRALLDEVAERTRAEQEIQLYADIFCNIQVGLYIYRLESLDDDRTLRMIAANPASEEFTGVSSKNVLGKTLDDNFPGLRRMGIPQRYAEVVRSGTPANFEDVYYDDDRVKRSVYSVQAFPLPDDCVGVVFENITERTQAEDELRTANEQLRQDQTEMERKNIAMREVLSQIEAEKQITRRQITTNVEETILPMIDEIRESCNPTQKDLLHLLEHNLREIASPFVDNLRNKFARLTPREQQICLMIKGGRTSKQIASLLNVSILTVHKHREQIRKKLGLTNSNVNLNSYLQTL